VSFCDNGTGIPESILQRIFEPFVTSKERGTGLGLAISRRILEQHGGRLTAVNREPCGAAFTVELPLSGELSAPAVTAGNGGTAVKRKDVRKPGAQV
jgi:signal transduction histidine kinase